MYDRRDYLDDKDIPNFPYLSENQQPGKVSYNDLPQPVVGEVTPEFFWNKYFQYSSSAYFEYRQIHLRTPDGNIDRTKCMQEAHIYYFHDCALAIMNDSRWRCYTDQEREELKRQGYVKWHIKMEVEPKFYYIGCDHDLQSTNVGRCLTQYTCTKCGFTEVVDSSD